jgi:hypothetical protein
MSFATTIQDQLELENEDLRKGKKPVPLLDEITMGPLEKYTKFNIFPWGLFFHILMLAVTSAQILLVINNLGLYTRSQEKVWRELFKEQVLTVNDVEFNGIRNIYTISTLSEHIQNCVNLYFDLDELYYTHVTQISEETGEPEIVPVMFESFYLRGTERNPFAQYSTNFTVGDYGVWGQGFDEIRSFLNQTTAFKMKYLIEHKITHESLFINDCFRWEITQDFDFFYRNHVIERFFFDTYP